MNGVAAWTLGASKVSTLLEGHDRKLWLVATGRAHADTLLDLRPVRWSSGSAWEDAMRARLRREFGMATEAVHYATFERETGLRIERRQLRATHPRLPLHATIDGTLEEWPGAIEPVDLKCTSQASKVPELMRDYQPQLTAQAMCLATCEEEATTAVLSVLWRTPKWGAFRMSLNPELRETIAERVAILGWHVMRDREPADQPAHPLPTPVWAPLSYGDNREPLPLAAE